MDKCVNCGRLFRQQSMYKKDTCNDKCMREKYYADKPKPLKNRMEIISRRVR
jgi:hypothetical protein